jgi:hypothetical protein
MAVSAVESLIAIVASSPTQDAQAAQHIFLLFFFKKTARLEMRARDVDAAMRREAGTRGARP